MRKVIGCFRYGAAPGKTGNLYPKGSRRAALQPCAPEHRRCASGVRTSSRGLPHDLLPASKPEADTDPCASVEAVMEVAINLVARKWKNSSRSFPHNKKRCASIRPNEALFGYPLGHQNRCSRDWRDTRFDLPDRFRWIYGMARIYLETPQESCAKNSPALRPSARWSMKACHKSVHFIFVFTRPSK